MKEKYEDNIDIVILYNRILSQKFFHYHIANPNKEPLHVFGYWLNFDSHSGKNDYT